MLLSRLTGKNKKEPAANPEPEEEKPDDDPYSGFGADDVASALQTDDLEYDEGFKVLIISMND